MVFTRSGGGAEGANCSKGMEPYFSLYGFSRLWLKSNCVIFDMYFAGFMNTYIYLFFTFRGDITSPPPTSYIIKPIAVSQKRGTSFIPRVVVGGLLWFDFWFAFCTQYTIPGSIYT